MPTARGARGEDVPRGVQPAAQLDALEALRQEQARLKAEYDRMEVSSCFWTSSLVGAVVHVLFFPGAQQRHVSFCYKAQQQFAIAAAAFC